MGGVLFGLSIGSMSGILCSAWLVKRFGTRNVIPGHDVLRIDRDDDIKSGTLADIAPALCRWSRRLWGKDFGSAEVAINVEGAAVEREMNKTVLPMMHGFIAPARWQALVSGWH